MKTLTKKYDYEKVRNGKKLPLICLDRNRYYREGIYVHQKINNFLNNIRLHQFNSLKVHNLKAKIS
jgi:hypothetical protein